MQHIYKITWSIGAIVYKLIFGSFGFPGYIGKPTFLMNARHIYIKSRVRIFPGIRAECHGRGTIQIGDNVSIGQGFHVIASSDLKISSGCLISGNVFITDTDHSYSNIETPVFNQINTVTTTSIGENCFIGTGARIQAGTILGNGCIVGANSVIRGAFPDHSVIVGSPGRIVKRFNTESGEWERVRASQH